MSPAAVRNPDVQLLLAAASGDGDGLAALYDRHRDGAIAVAISVLADLSDAEDVVQDVFVQLPRMARSYAHVAASRRNGSSGAFATGRSISFGGEPAGCGKS